MEGTRADKLAGLRAKKFELEALEERNNSLIKELNELENEVPVQ